MPSPMSATRCWRATTFPGSSWRLATRSDACLPTVTSMVPAKNDWEAALVGVRRRDQFLDDRGVHPVADSDERAPSTRLIGALSVQRMTIGLASRTPSGMSSTTP